MQRREGGVRAAYSCVRATCSGMRPALRRRCGGVGELCMAKSGGGGGGLGDGAAACSDVRGVRAV